ncbi:hypothetical protein V9K67_23480 [Paraflavisolibacter sp. H34]|uniref:hypothetical protein n=1 Tax=Huijunlia imazamoxiresistens TaxID=3127457 RepID=UPI003015A949
MENRENQQGAQRNHPSAPQERAGGTGTSRGDSLTQDPESTQNIDPVTMDTQKGKKVDADPSKESDRPAEQNR